MTRFRDAAPVFLVADVRATADYYRDVLGFCPGEVIGEPPAFCMLFRDGATIVLKRGEARPNEGDVADAFIGVDDVNALCQELERAGAHVVMRPTYRAIYDGWEMSVRDIDGRTILLTQAD